MSTRTAHPARPLDVAVVGGGIAGLATAALAARAGLAVALFEKAHELGGRAASRTKDGVVFNLGPHALYRGGEAARVLAELGVPTAGGAPSPNGAYALSGGSKHTLPGGFVSLLTTRLFGVPEKLEVARLLGSLARVDTASLASVSVRDWLATALRHAGVRRLVAALLRLSTYAADESQSAGAAVAQLELALARGVTYLDGGWQTLVDGLREAQVAKYLDPALDADPSADERELQGVLDVVQPGWRDVLRERRFLPRMVVTNALVTARGGGLAGRPGPAVPGAAGLYVVGDWVGPDGMLADAALASARRAATLVARDAGTRTAAA